ncbi:MAG: SDR family oxidoreductase, partial [bacterium]|nr:SDR family oxidoreductase [bacterium]
MEKNDDLTGLEVAVIGMAGRFPGAANIDEFWENIKNGVESISFFSDRELEEAGVEAHELSNPDYVKANGLLEGIEFFDPGFFGYRPAEAEIMDPQMRVFHECAWNSLENAGYNPDNYDGLIGLYAGAGAGFDWQMRVYLSKKAVEIGYFAASQLVNKDFLSLLVSYRLNLKGPAVILYSTCSTSLTAVHMACQAILNGECDMALAGGAGIKLPQKTGYMYVDGMINSPDGHCRVFDAKAKGTIGGNGAAAVVLKRLEQALEDGDHIYAVVKGSAVNNDGVRKIGFTAPSVEGEAEVIAAAQEMAEVEPESITYVEAHGTGTQLGDPVEIEALKLAFNSQKKGYCAIGSVKTNIGHLDTAAGIAGFIKAVQAINHRMIPPSLFFEKPNPKIDFENSPFYVNTRLKPWENDIYPLRAGVSSFGIGGTNVHAILEEAPGSEQEQTAHPDTPARENKLFLLSAKTGPALQRNTQNLVDYLKKKPGINLEDAAYTLQVGRGTFKHRMMTVGTGSEQIIENLSTPDSGESLAFTVKEEDPAVVFMLPGQGSQYVEMALELYQKEPFFREQLDRCFEILKPIMGYEIKEILYPGLTEKTGTPKEVKEAGINRTDIAQPLIFTIEYALAKLMIHWGIEPYAMIGHSIGEYAAACLAGVFSLEAALKAVAQRGKLMQQMPAGSMLSVSAAGEEITPLLIQGLTLAAVNSPSNSTISGPDELLHQMEQNLVAKGIQCRHLHTSHAFHSAMMEPILKTFEKTMEQINLKKPEIPYISNVSGNWINVGEATSPAYWAKHIRETVRFSKGVQLLLKDRNSIFVEVGPGKALSTFMKNHPVENMEKHRLKCVNLMRHQREEVPDLHFLTQKIGRIWLYGKKIDWQRFHEEKNRQRIPLPGYSFEKHRLPVIPQGTPLNAAPNFTLGELAGRRKADMADWFYIPVWEQSAPLEPSANTLRQENKKFNWLIFTDAKDTTGNTTNGGPGTVASMGDRLTELLRQDGHEPVEVKIGGAFTGITGNNCTLDPRNETDYQLLFAKLLEQGKAPHRIIHLWNLAGENPLDHGDGEIDRAMDTGFYSLMYALKAIGKAGITDEIKIQVVTRNMQNVTGLEEIHPLQAAVLGPVKIIPLEFPNIKCGSVDIENPGTGGRQEEFPAARLLEELEMELPDVVVAYRGRHRWVQRIKPHRLEKKAQSPYLQEKGVYLVTGGFGGMGFALAGYLAKEFQARLILVGRSNFPPRRQWQKWLENHEKEEKISAKIAKMQELEQYGTEIMTASADVSDEESMKKIVAEAEKKFGKINGIIHAAGVADYKGVILRRTREMNEEVMAAKVKGTIVLHR